MNTPSQTDSDGTTAPSNEIPAEPAIHTFNCYDLAFSHGLDPKRPFMMAATWLLTPHQREAIRRRDHGEETLAEIGRSLQRKRLDIPRLG